MKPLFYILILLILFIRCGGSYTPESPLIELKEKYKSKNGYTILLHDMDLRNEQHYHKYKIIFLGENGRYNVVKTKWFPVDEDFFMLHEGDLGMEVLSKLPNGDFNNLPTPPGFTQIIGQDTYGYWNDTIYVMDTLSNQLDTLNIELSQAVWKFKNKYAGLGDALSVDSMTIQYSEYEEFKSSFHLNRPYYGTEEEEASRTHYGTYSRHWFRRRPEFYERRNRKDNFYTKNMKSKSGGTRGGGGFGK